MFALMFVSTWSSPDLLSLSPTTRGTDAFSARKNTFAITSDGETGDNRRLKIIIKEVHFRHAPFIVSWKTFEYFVVNFELVLIIWPQMRRDAEALFAEMQKAVSEVSVYSGNANT